eukprot:5561786-Pyramimonas_sp.AAC.2
MFVDAIGQASIPIVGLVRGPISVKLQHMQDGEAHYAGTLYLDVEVRAKRRRQALCNTTV